MKPHVKQVDIYRGDYFVESFRIRERVWNPALNAGSGGWEPGDYRDLTGWSGIWQIRKTEDDTAILGTGVVTILDQVATRGGVQYAMEANITEALPAGEARYDVQLTDDLGKPRTFLAGKVVVSKDVSRA